MPSKGVGQSGHLLSTHPQSQNDTRPSYCLIRLGSMGLETTGYFFPSQFLASLNEDRIAVLRSLLGIMVAELNRE